jgi:hypothetical protein
VALFGPAATRRVGTAATAALHDGRWAALHLASAASDLLGPEQLERVLALIEPGADPEPGDPEPYGLASQVATDLARVLEPYPRPRRLALLLDLWGVVAAQRIAAAGRRALRELCGGDERVEPVRTRYRALVDQELSGMFPEGRPADLLRWVPGPGFWEDWFTRTMADAFAATVLLRTAVAVAEDGLIAGLDRVRRLLSLAPNLLRRNERARARRGEPGVPARPGVLVYELHAQPWRTTNGNPGLAEAVHNRLSLARAYGVVVLDEAQALIEQWAYAQAALPIRWRPRTLMAWREFAGYTSVRPPEEWRQPVLGQVSFHDGEQAPAPLAQRLADQPDADPSTVETLGDMLWFAELADAVAQVEGRAVAPVQLGEFYPWIDAHAGEPEREPLRPHEDSVQRAAAGAALLLELGAQPPAKPRTWSELVDGLLESAVVAEALTGSFAVPRALLDRDGVALPPGADDEGVTVEIARDVHQLVAWAQYMGNCISGPYYVAEALQGRSVLAALRATNGVLVANVELRPQRNAWRVGEFRMRFNAPVSSALDTRLRSWVAALPPPRPRAVTPGPGRAHHGDRRPHRRGSELAPLRAALVPATTEALASPEVQIAIDVMSLDGSGMAGLTALRRLGPVAFDETVRSALAAGVHLLGLWRASAVRPLARALSTLEPAKPERTGSLAALLVDAPLPALPRRLARSPEIGAARTVEIVARRLRRTLGRLAAADDPVLARLVPGQADVGLLCALVLATSTSPGAAATTTITAARDARVPGHPASTVDDPHGPWYAARGDAVELGADASRLPAAGLLAPTSWLPRGGWPVLWARAHRRGRT